MSQYNLADLIKYPVLTNKATRLFEQRQYSFITDPRATKDAIKLAVEHLFCVTVVSVNTLRFSSKERRVGKFTGRKRVHKKAIVTLGLNHRIHLFPEH